MLHGHDINIHQITSIATSKFLGDRDELESLAMNGLAGAMKRVDWTRDTKQVARYLIQGAVFGIRQGRTTLKKARDMEHWIGYATTSRRFSAGADVVENMAGEPVAAPSTLLLSSTDVEAEVALSGALEKFVEALWVVAEEVVEEADKAHSDLQWDTLWGKRTRRAATAVALAVDAVCVKVARVAGLPIGPQLVYELLETYNLTSTRRHPRRR